MHMGFVIQISNPTIRSPQSKQVTDVAWAIQEIFPMITEDAFLIWNGIPIRINYKYDLSVLIDDLLPMLAVLLGTEEGSYEVGWGSDTFRADWVLTWTGNQTTVATKWHSVSGGYEDLLNTRSQLEIERIAFLREWKTLLKKVIDSIKSAGIVITDKANLDLLYKIEAEIPTDGYLYVD